MQWLFNNDNNRLVYGSECLRNALVLNEACSLNRIIMKYLMRKYACAINFQDLVNSRNYITTNIFYVFRLPIIIAHDFD